MSAEPSVVPAASPSDAQDAPVHSPLYAKVPARPLRVAFVVPTRVPAWIAKMLELSAEHDWLELTAVPVAGLPVAQARVGADLRALLRHERLRRPLDSDAFAVTALPVSMRDADLDSIQSRVAALRPDLVLLWGAAQWAQPLASHAMRGCWTIDATLGDAFGAAQALLSPLLRGDTATPLQLELAIGGKPALALASTWGSTCQASATKQCEDAFCKLPALFLRSLRGLQQGEHAWPQEYTAANLRIKASPLPPAAALRALAHTIVERLRARWHQERQPHEDPWFVLVRKGDEPLDPDRPGIPRYQALVGSDDLRPQIWADPCCVDGDGRRLVFVEECTPDQRVAHIACLEVPEQGPARRLGVVLDRAYHLSFPLVFHWEGQWYMTVESGQAGCVTLYRAQEFPLSWQPAAELLSGRLCVDPVLHHHEGRWYLFVNISESGGSTWDELFLFVSDTLTGPYLPHPANPIVADVRRARSAGQLFHHHGRLIRPAQDCARNYGSATVFNEVLELSPTSYRERPLGRLGSDWTPAIDGCHTYSSSAAFEVLDARGVPAKSACIPVLQHSGNAPVSMSQDATVSVVMPAYNAAKTVSDSMRSVLEQTHSHVELIVVDDCSSDGTWHLVQQFAAADPRVVALRLERNQGVAAARNTGMQAATGRYIAFLDSDDRWHPRKLEIQLTGMRQTGALASYAAYERVAEDGRALSTVRPPRLVRYEDMLKSNCIGNLTGMYDRKLGDPRFQKIGHEDYVFWLRIVKLAGSAVCAGWPEPLAYYLTRQGSLSANKLKAVGWQWRIYRDVECIGRARAARYLVHYAVRALAKRV